MLRALQKVSRNCIWDGKKPSRSILAWAGLVVWLRRQSTSRWEVKSRMAMDCRKTCRTSKHTSLETSLDCIFVPVFVWGAVCFQRVDTVPVSYYDSRLNVQIRTVFRFSTEKLWCSGSSEDSAVMMRLVIGSWHVKRRKKSGDHYSTIPQWEWGSHSHWEIVQLVEIVIFLMLYLEIAWLGFWSTCMIWYGRGEHSNCASQNITVSRPHQYCISIRLHCNLQSYAPTSWTTPENSKYDAHKTWQLHNFIVN